MGRTKEFLDRLTPQQLVVRLSRVLEDTPLGACTWDPRDASAPLDDRRRAPFPTSACAGDL